MLSGTMIAALCAIAADRYGYGTNTAAALRRRGLTNGREITAAGHAAVADLRFAVVYYVRIGGRNVARRWDAGLTLAAAADEAADVRLNGPADPDAIFLPNGHGRIYMVEIEPC